MTTDESSAVTTRRPWYVEFLTYLAWYGGQAVLLWTVVIAIAWFGGYQGFSTAWFGRFAVVAAGSGFLLTLVRYAADRGVSNV